jgi:mannose-6-phosphate isomerase-like protein (cupin superfamily)
MALCQMTLPPFGESRDVPEEKGHYHERTTEIYCFTQGNGRMLLNNHWQDVRHGSIVLVPPKVMHTLSAGAEGVECLVWTIPAYDPADMFDLFDYPAQFSRFDPVWIKTLPDTPPGESLMLHDLFETPNYEFGFVQLAPHAGVPLHQHDRKDEAYFILSGSAHMVLGDQVGTITPGCLVSIPDRVKHGITAGVEGVNYLEAGVILE